MVKEMVKRWGKSPPDIMVTWYAARLMGCKAMYTGTWKVSSRMPQWAARPSPGGRLLERRSKARRHLDK